MSSIERKTDWFWQRVAASTAPVLEGLPALRVLTGLFLLCFAAPYLGWLRDVPPAYYSPPLLSLGRLLPSFPPPWFCSALDVVLLSLCALVTLGVRARLSTLLLCGLGLVRSNIAYSFGKIDHDILLYVFLGCMAFSGWGRRLALLPDADHRLDEPLRAFAILGACLAYAMSSVGLQKSVNWLDFNLDTSGFLNWFLTGYFEYGRNAFLAPYVLELPRAALELMDYSGVVFELSCLPALLHGRRTFRVWLCCACVFHLLNTLTLNIPFLVHVLPYAAFVDLSGPARWLGRILGRAWSRIAFALVVAALPVAHTALRASGHGSALLFCVTGPERLRLELYLAIAFWGTGVLVMLREVARLGLQSSSDRALELRP